MGIYKSNLSCWQRRTMGLPQDHAGDKVIAENKAIELPKEVIEVAEPVQEVEIDLSAAATQAKVFAKAAKKDAKKKSKKK